MKIAVGGIEHESSNFTPVETPLSMFQRELHYFEGSQLSARAGDTNTIVDGFLTGLREHNQQIAPLLWAKAPSGGQPTLETHEYLKNRLLDRLRDQLPVDGVLLSLHGAYSVQGVDDGDGDITAADAVTLQKIVLGWFRFSQDLVVKPPPSSEECYFECDITLFDEYNHHVTDPERTSVKFEVGVAGGVGEGIVVDQPLSCRLGCGGPWPRGFMCPPRLSPGPPGCLLLLVFRAESPPGWRALCPASP